MQKHTLQSKVIYRNMLVSLYVCLLQSLPCPLVCSYAYVVLMCDWWTCYDCYYNYFDILVGGGGDLKFDQVSFLDYFIYRAGDAPMIFLFRCEKVIHDTADCGLVFLIVDAPCAYVDEMYIRHYFYAIIFRISNYQ